MHDVLVSLIALLREHLHSTILHRCSFSFALCHASLHRGESTNSLLHFDAVYIQSYSLVA